jgi:hypothetical protein
METESNSLGIHERRNIPTRFQFERNYPNPFNPTTTLRFELPLAVEVVLYIYDLTGREVIRLVDRRLEAGYHQQDWNGRDTHGRELPSGVYIARLVTPAYNKSIKMVLLK